MSEALVSTSHDSLTTRTESWVDIFQQFRVVFDAGECLRRKIYWVENKWGNTILREVSKLPRASKKDDSVVATIPGDLDLDAVRLTIANTNRGRILTGIRWEIYQDFALEDLALSGRFDHIDLLIDIPQTKLQRLADSQVATFDHDPMSWDFDGILLTHHCFSCRSRLERTFLVFIPEFQTCKKCFGASEQKTVTGTGLEIFKKVSTYGTAPMVSHLIVAGRMLERLTRIGSVHAVANPRKNSPLLFIDVHATPLFCWLFTEIMKGNPFMECAMRDMGGGKALSLDGLKSCLQLSIFPALKVSVVRDAFIRSGIEYYDRRIAQTKTSDPWLPKELQQQIDEKTLNAEELPIWFTREGRVRNWEQEAQKFRDHTECLAGLEAWLEGPSLSAKQPREFTTAYLETQRRFMDAASEFPTVMENLIEVAFEAQKDESC